MKIAGWIFMCSAWGLILGYTVFCVVKIFSTESKAESGDDEE